MSAREEILQRVRAGLAKGDAAARRIAAETLMRNPVRGPQPGLDADLTRRFASKAQYLASSVEHVDGPAQAPTAVARYLADQGLPLLAVATGDVAGFDWPGSGVEIAVRGAARRASLGSRSACPHRTHGNSQGPAIDGEDHFHQFPHPERTR